MGMRFRHEVIDTDPPGSHHDITLVADLTGQFAGRRQHQGLGRRPLLVRP